MDKAHAYEILTRLGEKGILGRATSKEINKDIKSFIREEGEKNNSQFK